MHGRMKNLTGRRTERKSQKGNIAMIPKDPVMLLSYLNTQLRDFYPSLSRLCEDKQLDQKEVEDKLALIDYIYDSRLNQFV